MRALPEGVCPSGQRERAVNPSAQPTEVRILPPPLTHAPVAYSSEHGDFALAEERVRFGQCGSVADRGE